MNGILDRLKEAEAERQRVIAGRKRLEAEADAALETREREERAKSQAVVHVKMEQRAAQPMRSNRSPLAGAAIAIALVLGAGLWSTTFFAEKEPARQAAKEVRAEPKPEPDGGMSSIRLNLDRDVDAFGARVREKGKK